jgi:hypothetical protein
MRLCNARIKTILMKKCLSFFAFIPIFATSQIETTTWRDHLPYGKAIDVVLAGTTVYTATPFGLFSYDPLTGSTERLNKTNKLSDTGVSCVDYDPETDLVIVGYTNGNIDLLGKSVKVNVPDIKINSLIGDKAIYGMSIQNKKAYLATGFGIVVLDLERFEIKDSYLIGENGSQLFIHDVEIFRIHCMHVPISEFEKHTLMHPFWPTFKIGLIGMDYLGIPPS